MAARVCWSCGEGQRQEVHDEEDDGTEKEPAGLAQPLEALLRRGQDLPLLVERLVGAPGPHFFGQGSLPPSRETCFPIPAAQYSGSSPVCPSGCTPDCRRSGVL